MKAEVLARFVEMHMMRRHHRRALPLLKRHFDEEHRDQYETISLSIGEYRGSLAAAGSSRLSLFPAAVVYEAMRRRAQTLESRDIAPVAVGKIAHRSSLRIIEKIVKRHFATP